MADIKKLLGKRIKELRKSKNYTQEKFSELLDMDQRNLSAIECGINFPTKHFIEMAKVLDVDIKDLFDFEHLDLSEHQLREKSKNFIDELDIHDLHIVYRLLKSMLK